MASPMSLTRPMLRSPALRQLAARRFESTASEKATQAARDTANKASQAARDTAAKASQGLSRVTSAAGPAIAGAAKSLGRLGGRTGKLIAFLERQTPFVVYYSKVAVEVGKYVARNQKMSIPSAATFQSIYQGLWQSIVSGSILRSPQSLINSARNLSAAQLAAGGVLFAETLGFFTVGEMIGRFKLVGYHGEAGAHH